MGTFTKCVAKDLPDTPVGRVIVDPSNGNIYAATWVGVYVSTDRCASFARLGIDLPNVQVRDLYLASGLLRAGTYGRSAWELPL